jgi:hypothetical protein
MGQIKDQKAVISTQLDLQIKQIWVVEIILPPIFHKY